MSYKGNVLCQIYIPLGGDQWTYMVARVLYLCDIGQYLIRLWKLRLYIVIVREPWGWGTQCYIAKLPTRNSKKYSDNNFEEAVAFPQSAWSKRESGKEATVTWKIQFQKFQYHFFHILLIRYKSLSPTTEELGFTLGGEEYTSGTILKSSQLPRCNCL